MAAGALKGRGSLLKRHTPHRLGVAVLSNTGRPHGTRPCVYTGEATLSEPTPTGESLAAFPAHAPAMHLVDDEASAR